MDRTRLVALVALAALLRLAFSAWFDFRAGWALLTEAQPATVAAGILVGVASTAWVVGLVWGFRRLLDDPRPMGWVAWLVLVGASALFTARLVALAFVLAVALATLTGEWGRLNARLALGLLALVSLASNADQWPAAGRVDYGGGGEHYGRVLHVGADEVVFLSHPEPPNVSVERIHPSEYQGLMSCPRPWLLRFVVDLSDEPEVDHCNN